jgi:hypothetical protein
MKWFKFYLARRHVKTNDSVRQRDTWSERLTDRDNYWLNAVNAEDDGILFEAIEFYVKDAIRCLNQASLERTALSCSCAANCLRKIGNTLYANRLYLEAAILYEENAHYMMIFQSVKGSLWSLQEAYEHYILAEDFGRAQIIYEEYMSLAAKLNPLFGLRETVQSLEFRKATAESIQSNNKTITKSAIQKATMQISLEVTNTIDHFLQMRRESKTNNNVLKLEKSDSRPTFTAIRSNAGES